MELPIILTPTRNEETKEEDEKLYSPPLESELLISDRDDLNKNDKHLVAQE